LENSCGKIYIVRPNSYYGVKTYQKEYKKGKAAYKAIESELSYRTRSPSQAISKKGKRPKKELSEKRTVSRVGGGHSAGAYTISGREK